MRNLQDKRGDSVKARFNNILKEEFDNDTSKLTLITEWEFKHYRKVGQNTIKYAIEILKQNNLTFKQSPCYKPVCDHVYEEVEHGYGNTCLRCTKCGEITD